MKKLERNLFKLTWPIFIELLFFMIMGSVDTLMLSKYSDDAVAAVGNANSVVNLFGVLLSIIGIGIAVVVSQYLGAGKEEEAKIAVKSGIITNLVVGIVILIILLIFGELIFTVIRTDQNIIDWSLQYLKTMAFALVFVSLTSGISAAFRSFGKPKVVMAVVIAANILNVFLNWVFIFGNLGAPQLGVFGAALGTLISRGFILVLLFSLMLWILKINALKVEYHPSSVRKILKVGVPSALENFTYSLTQIIILSFVNTLGNESVTARSYFLVLTMYIYIFALAFASANSILVGYYIGENKPDAAYSRTIKTIKITFVFIVIMVIVMNILADPILRLLTDNETIIKIAKGVFRISIFLEMGRAMNLVYIQALRATGDTIFPLKMALISMLGISVVFAYVFGVLLGIGLLGVFIGASMDEIFRGLSMLFRWKNRKWEHRSFVND